MNDAQIDGMACTVCGEFDGSMVPVGHGPRGQVFVHEHCCSTCESCGERFTPKIKRPSDPPRFCSASCRREAYRVARLAAGEADGPYRSLTQYKARKVRANRAVRV